MNPALPGMPEMPLAFEFCYEWKTPFGVHRKFNPSAYNGSKYHNAFTLYTKEQVVEFARAYGESCFAAGRAEASKDAERYRWLRTFPNNLDACVYGQTFNRNFGGGLLRRDEFLDAAIDTAMAPPAATPTKEQP